MLKAAKGDAQSHIDVIIDTKGWDSDTIELQLASIRSGRGGTQGAVITTESSTTDALGAAESFPEIDIYYYNGTESHSTTINNGVANAQSEWVLILDDFTLLSPRAVENSLEFAQINDWNAVQLERRTLRIPPTHTAQRELATKPYNYLDSTPRSRWNRGNALLIRRTDFLRVRGYDERPAVQDYAPLDLIVRLARAGLSVGEAAGPQLCAYVPDATARFGFDSSATRDSNRELVESDQTIYRNLTKWSVPKRMRPVLVTVCIATRDRAAYIGDSIRSVLLQTFEDFEIIVVDDGSEDNTEESVRSVNDDRIRYIRQEPRGISAARNLGADKSAGYFTAVHDDDDIMLPNRLEISLSALTSAYDASYGSWVNFSNDTGEMVLHVIRRGFSPELIAFNGQGPGHSTWLLPTADITRVRYDETLSSSVDHNLATRLAWEGMKWVHTERVMFLRRMHSAQVSAVDGGRQKTAHVLGRFANTFAAGALGRKHLMEMGSKNLNPSIPEKKDLHGSFDAYLPDHLVKRSALISNNVTPKIIAIDRYDGVDYVLAEHDLSSGKLRLERAGIGDITWEDMVRIRASEVVGIEISATLEDNALGNENTGDPGQPTPNADTHSTDYTSVDHLEKHSDQMLEAALSQLEEDRSASAETALNRRLDEHFSIADARYGSKNAAWIISPDSQLTPMETMRLSPARAVEITVASDNGVRHSVTAFSYATTTDAIRDVALIQPATEVGRAHLMLSASLDMKHQVDLILSSSVPRPE